MAQLRVSELHREYEFNHALHMDLCNLSHHSRTNQATAEVEKISV